MRRSLSISFLLLITCFLFAQKEDINTRFLQAVKEGNVQDVELCLKKGANVNCVDSTGRTPLHWASGAHLYKIAEFLIKNGATINVKDREGSTPLMYTGESGDLRICYLLYKNGADFKPSDSFGKTALDYANAGGYIRIKEFLANPKTYNEDPSYIEYLYLANEQNNKVEYDKAILNYEKGLERIKKEILNLKSPYYSATLNNLAVLYLKIGEYTKAEKLMLEALKIQKEVLGEKHPDYATSLNNLALLYQEMGKYSKAEPLCEEALKLRKDILGVNHPDYAVSINNLAALYYKMGNYTKSEPLMWESLKIQKEVLGERNPTYALILNNLAMLYQEMGDYSKSESICKESLKIRKDVLGVNHPDYAQSLNNLAILYQLMGSYSKAEAIYIDAIKIQKEVLGENHPGYVQTISNLASLYEDIGNFIKAEKYCLKAIEIRKEILGENHPDYATSLNNLAHLYVYMGNYSKAEPIYLKTLKIQKEVLGEKHPFYATTLNNLATFYFELGNYSKAEPFCQEALKIQKEVLGNNHLDYATSLNVLARIYEETGEYIKAKSIYSEVVKIKKEVLGVKHPYYATSLNNLASFYTHIREYSKAEPIYFDALKITKEALGDNHPDYVTSLNNLAGVYAHLGKYVKAEEIYIDALTISKRIFNENDPENTTFLNNIASFYCEIENYSKAEPLIRESYKTFIDNLYTNFSFLSENERELFWNKEKSIFNISYPSFTYNYHIQKPTISTFAYDNTLFTKGLLLNTSLQIQNAVLQSGDPVLINTWNTLRDVKRQITQLQSKPLSQQMDLPVMEARADSLDKVLTQKSQLYKQSQSDMQVNWTDVQKNLKPDEAAIEFISFNYFNKHYTDSTMYCALVLKKNSPYPEMIPLFEEKQLDSLFVKSSSDVNQLYTYRVTNLRKDSVESRLNYGSKLYNLLWKPLEASLKNMITVYFAPSGKLNQVAFAAIPVDSALLLSDKYNLHQFTSTRQVIHNNEQDKQTAKIHDAALFGGIQYELDNKQLAQVQTTTGTSYRSTFVSDSTQRSGSFGYLKGTGEEVTGIADEFKQKGLTEQLYTGAIASETAFKKLNGTNTDIIHIATHGFYLPIEKTKPEDFRFMSFDNERRNVVYHNPLLRSGLVMAGANRAWRGDTIPDNWEDGILTAHEISQVNLTHTDLVVLSACETALGEVKGSEGVFGLQRAFKMAGVQTLIMSLWKVPDTQTSQLMQGFYKYWLGGMTKHDAFKKSQDEIRKANPNPYYWAAFVMVD